MNYIHHSILDREKISFAIHFVSGDNGYLSQKYLAVSPNCQNWLFLRSNTATSGIGAGVNPSHKDFVQTKYLPFYDRDIPQNKPFGEYVGRLLDIPRVISLSPIFWAISQTLNYLGAFTMNAIITPFKSFHLSAADSFLIGCLLGLPIACLVIAALWLMGV